MYNIFAEIADDTHESSQTRNTPRISRQDYFIGTFPNAMKLSTFTLVSCLISAANASTNFRGVSRNLGATAVTGTLSFTESSFERKSKKSKESSDVKGEPAVEEDELAGTDTFPTLSPSASPAPSGGPSGVPSLVPSDMPSGMPSGVLDDGTAAGSVPTLAPSASPAPSGGPSEVPSSLPSLEPSGVDDEARKLGILDELELFGEDPDAFTAATPTLAPSISPGPSGEPSSLPSGAPSDGAGRRLGLAGAVDDEARKLGVLDELELFGEDPDAFTAATPTLAPSISPGPSGEPSSLPSGAPSDGAGGRVGLASADAAEGTLILPAGEDSAPSLAPSTSPGPSDVPSLTPSASPAPSGGPSGAPSDGEDERRLETNMLLH